MARTRGRWEMRVDEELLEAARAKAHRLGVSLSTVTRGMWREWVAEEEV